MGMIEDISGSDDAEVSGQPMFPALSESRSNPELMSRRLRSLIHLYTSGILVRIH